MFDVLLKELAKRLNLGERAPGLLGMLLSVIFDEKRGGFSGFIDRFRSAGHGELLTSWLGNGENKALSSAQLESVLGPQLVGQMASRLDLAPGTINTALGQLIPTVIDKLSPDGKLPQGLALPEALKGYLGAFGDFAQTAVLPEVTQKYAAQHTLDHGPAHGRRAGASKLWLALIPVLIAPLFFIKQCAHDPGNPPKTMSIPSGEVSAPLETQSSATTAATESATSGISSGTPETIEVAPTQITDAAPDAAQAALAALASATTFSNEALITALNLMVVRFDSGTANIKADSLAIIEQAAGVMKKLAPETRLAITGHTDSRGPAADNITLSQARADAVLAKLVELGIGAAQMQSAGMGDREPVADNATKEGRAKNRRIQFAIAQ